MSQIVSIRKEESTPELSLVEQVVMQGDLSKLTSEQRVIYYRKVCESVGLNPFTRPFDYINLGGKLTLYAKKDATEQLRKLNGISIEKLESKVIDDLYIVTATARTKDGRTDEATGAVTIGHLKGDIKANAIMKAETKAKRRVTLSISGMGWMDESEIETIPNSRKAHVDLDTGELNYKEVLLDISKIGKEKSDELHSLMENSTDQYKEWLVSLLQKRFKTIDISEIPLDEYEKLKDSILNSPKKPIETTPELFEVVQ